jgi:phosphatidylserine/phosphatidylglycerophosphate/cardiolipin synthase-like enzyme
LAEFDIMSCQVSPDALRKYIRAGVNVYTTRYLHAKVFILGTTVIVGSTNVSFASQNRLEEAIVETTDRRVLAAGHSGFKGPNVDETVRSPTLLPRHAARGL